MLMLDRFLLGISLVFQEKIKLNHKFHLQSMVACNDIDEFVVFPTDELLKPLRDILGKPMLFEAAVKVRQDNIL